MRAVRFMGLLGRRWSSICLYAHNGKAYLVEVKSHLKPSDVLIFDRKIKFAAQQLARQVIPLLIALSMEPRAEQQMRELGIKYRVRSVVSYQT